MSLNLENLKCARCSAYLFENDDVVFCPECGAPHHRECYSALGHCALEEFHGTQNQYSANDEPQNIKSENSQEDKKEDYIVCNNCHEKYPVTEKYCLKCHSPNPLKFPGFSQFDFLGGIPADYIIEDDITAEETKKFVATNTHRYIPKFVSITKSNKISWNWMAFLFPFEWALSRKIFKPAFILGFLQIISVLFSYPLAASLNTLGLSQATSTEILTAVTNNFSSLIWPIILSLIAFVIGLASSIIAGLFGDYIYKNHTISAIKKIKAESEDIETDFIKKGGVNILLFFVGMIITQYLPNIILTFL